MNEQEKQLIEGLATRIHNAPAPEIDREADALIRNGIGGRPDALYILTQTVLLQEMALKQAMGQIEELKKHGADSAPRSGSILGSPVAPAPGQPGGSPQQQPATAPAAPPVPSPASAPPYSAVPQVAPQAPAAGGGMLSGFLRSAATTAAGVIAGETAFSALSGLFGHHSGPGAGSGFLGGVSGVSPGSETIINNYYGEQTEDRSSTPAAATLAGNDATDPAPGDDADRDADDSYHTETAADSEDSYDDSAQDDSAQDDSAPDDSAVDSGDDSDDDDGGGPFDL